MIALEWLTHDFQFDPITGLRLPRTDRAAKFDVFRKGHIFRHRRFTRGETHENGRDLFDDVNALPKPIGTGLARIVNLQTFGFEIVICGQLILRLPDHISTVLFDFKVVKNLLNVRFRIRRAFPRFDQRGR